MTYHFTIRDGFTGKKPFAWAVSCDALGSAAGTSGTRELAEKEARSWAARWRKGGETNIRSEVVAGA